MGESPGGSPPDKNYRHNPGLGKQNYFKDESSYFLIVKNLSDPENSFKKVPTFLYSKALCTMVGVQNKTLTIEPLKSGDLMVKVQNQHQSDILSKATKLEGTDYNISVTPDKKANFSKCKVFCNIWEHMTEKEIQDGLADEKCIGVYRIQSRKNGQLVNTNIYILSFESPYPPQRIYNGCYYINTQIHISYPLQCKNCFKLNHHTTKKCPKLMEEKCSKCQLYHSGSCEDHKCINCHYDPSCNHKENDRKCPEWCYLYEIEYCMAMDRISKREARISVNKLLIEGAFNNTPVHNVLKRIGQDKNQIKPTYASTIQARMDKIRNGNNENMTKAGNSSNSKTQISNNFKEPLTTKSVIETALNAQNQNMHLKPKKTQKNHKNISKNSDNSIIYDTNMIDEINNMSQQTPNIKTPTKRSHSTESTSSMDSSSTISSKKSSRISRQLKDFSRHEKKVIKKQAALNSDSDITDLTEVTNYNDS